MYWLVLVVSGVLEAVWATALDRSEGFTKLGPSIIFVAGMIASMAGLAYALRELPVGTVGIGAVVTVAWAMLTGAESISPVKILFLLMIIGGVVGLKPVH